MNLLWVAKLFMSLIAKFLHASLPFLASEPKSNSARRNTHTRAYPYAYTYLTQSRWNLHTQRAHTHTHMLARWLAFVPACTQIHISWGEKAEVFSAAGLALVKTKDQHGDELRSHYLSMPGPILWVISISLQEMEEDWELLCLLKKASLQIIRKCAPSSVYKHTKWHLALCEIKINHSVEYLWAYCSKIWVYSLP